MSLLKDHMLSRSKSTGKSKFTDCGSKSQVTVSPQVEARTCVGPLGYCLNHTETVARVTRIFFSNIELQIQSLDYFSSNQMARVLVNLVTIKWLAVEVGGFSR